MTACIGRRSKPSVWLRPCAGQRFLWMKGDWSGPKGDKSLGSGDGQNESQHGGESPEPEASDWGSSVTRLRNVVSRCEEVEHEQRGNNDCNYQ